MISWLLKGLGALLPRDEVPRCGVWPFILPEEHPFGPACMLHDSAFDAAREGAAERSLIEEDIALFHRFALIAKNQPTPLEQLSLIEDICNYWPLARKFGRYRWEGKL